ncbi:signal peptidase complex catalytic subunit SEC11 [Mycena floridula]|nr:signal peptidase complex catalytic subunit SEC11 [Mycena floridula]
MLPESFKNIRRFGVRHVLFQALSFALTISSSLMIYKFLCLLTNSASPVVVVLSGSMEPAFSRGDIIFMTNLPHERYKTGDIMVYKIPGADIPIVHRVLETHDTPGTLKQLMLTKGDNNDIDDLELYKGLEWLERHHIVGKVRGFLPYVGYVTIVMDDFPGLKYMLLAALGLGALVQRD